MRRLWFITRAWFNHYRYKWFPDCLWFESIYTKVIVFVVTIGPLVLFLLSHNPSPKDTQKYSTITYSHEEIHHPTEFQPGKVAIASEVNKMFDDAREATVAIWAESVTLDTFECGVDTLSCEPVEIWVKGTNNSEEVVVASLVMHKEEKL